MLPTWLLSQTKETAASSLILQIPQTESLTGRYFIQSHNVPDGNTTRRNGSVRAACPSFRQRPTPLTMWQRVLVLGRRGFRAVRCSILRWADMSLRGLAELGQTWSPTPPTLPTACPRKPRSVVRNEGVWGMSLQNIPASLEAGCTARTLP
jgi:glutamate/tyrosine decarboxylase-like PLP-dependent enzyme